MPNLVERGGISRRILTESEKCGVWQTEFVQAIAVREAILQKFRRSGLYDVVNELSSGLPPELENFSDPATLPWNVEVLNPKLNDYGEWDLNLRIRVSKADPVSILRSFLHRVVLITMAPEDNLTVTGREETFSGSMVDPDDATLELARAGIKQAFKEPLTKRVKTRLPYGLGA